MKQPSIPLHGVNLGGWLVLEKWMTPSLFMGTDAVDEYTFVRTAGAATKVRRHRDTFITEADFKWLQQYGITGVRLPVGFWALEHHDPLLNATKYVDWVFAMAEKYNIAVVLCLHGASGSQNGNDHSGRIGPAHWFKRKHRRRTAASLMRLLNRYGDHPVLWGFELLNEPTPKTWWQRTILRHWTRSTIRKLSKQFPDVRLIFSDAFAPDSWSSTMRHSQAVMDVHHYQSFSPEDRALSVTQHVQKAHAVGAAIERWQRDQPVIIGEWSLGLDTTSLNGVTRQVAEAQFARAQVTAYAHANAWFFWSYKTERNDGWNFRYLVEQGILDF